MRLAAVTAAVLAILVSGCGGGDETPADAVHGYLHAVADNDGEKACDLLTVQARAKLVSEAGTTDCPSLVTTLHKFLGDDAGRLKDAEVNVTSEVSDSATATASLDGRSVDVDLERIGGDWRLDTGRVVTTLLGIPQGG